METAGLEIVFCWGVWCGGRDRTWGLEFAKRPPLNSRLRPSVVIPSLLLGGQGLPELSRLVSIFLGGPGRP